MVTSRLLTEKGEWFPLFFFCLWFGMFYQNPEGKVGGLGGAYFALLLVAEENTELPPSQLRREGDPRRNKPLPPPRVPILQFFKL